MTAKEQTIEYAKKHNNGTMTDEQFFGQMIKGGVAIARTPNSKTIAQATRQGNEIIVTEKTITTVNEIVNGKITTKTEEAIIEVFRATI